MVQMRAFLAIALLAMTGCLHAQTAGYHQLDINPLSASPGVVNLTDKTSLGVVADQITGYAGVLNLMSGGVLAGTTWTATNTSAMLIQQAAASNEIVFFDNTGLTVGHTFSPSPFFAITNYSGGTELTDSAHSTTLTLGSPATINAGFSAIGNILVTGTSGQSTDFLDIKNFSGGTVMSVSPSGTGLLDLTGYLYLEATGTATSGANDPAFPLEFRGSYWNGSSAGVDTWTIEPILGTGANPTSTLTISHTPGSAGAATVQVVNLDVTGTCTGCGSGSPGGSNTQVQVNASGSFAGYSGLTWDNGTTTLGATFLSATGIVTSASALLNGATTITPVGTSQVPLTVQKNSGQTADLLDIKGVFPTVYLAMDSSGDTSLFAALTELATNTAVSSTNYPSFPVNWASSYWDSSGGGSAKTDSWSMYVSAGSGSNPTETLTIAHNFGTTGPVAVGGPDFLWQSGTPTIAGTGSPACTVGSLVGNDHAGTFSVASAGASCTGIMTFIYTAPHGWSCQLHDQSVTVGVGSSVFISQIIFSSTTQAEFIYNLVGPDTINYTCDPF